VPATSENLVVADGTVWGSPEWYDNRWNALTPQERERIAAYLRTELPPAALDQFRTAKGIGIDRKQWIATNHFFGGMHIRNVLRAVMLDSELPPAPYPGGKTYCNWDDYYLQALEAAAYTRE
jgi:hypothetical protein